MAWASSLSTADTLLAEAVLNYGYQSNLRNWYAVTLPLKGAAPLLFTGREVTGIASDPETPPWERLILWEDAAGGHVAARGWARHSDPKLPMIWKAGRPATVGDAMDIWGWTPLAIDLAIRLKCNVRPA